MKKYLSRKFITSWCGISLLAILPILFSQNGVGIEVQMLSLSCIAFATGTYVWGNVKSNGS